MKSIYSDIPKIMGIFLTIVLVIGSVLPISNADAYAHKLYCFGDVTFNDCPKWSEDKIKNLTIVLIDRIHSDVHTQLVKDAIATWKYYVPVFNYTINVPTTHPTDITIYIDESSMCAFGANPCAAGTTISYNTDNVNYPEDFKNGKQQITIKYAMISMGRDACIGDKVYICREYNLQLFYRLALHEFGHALGLGHSVKENYNFPIDIMDAKVLSPDAQVTKLDIKKLQSIYSVMEHSPMPDMNNDCTWLICYYVQGRINDQWHDKADAKMLEYDSVHGCASWWVTIPTHNVDKWGVHVVFWDDVTVVSMAKFNITESQEVSFCTSMKTDGAQLGLY